MRASTAQVRAGRKDDIFFTRYTAGNLSGIVSGPFPDGGSWQHRSAGWPPPRDGASSEGKSGLWRDLFVLDC